MTQKTNTAIHSKKREITAITEKFNEEKAQI
jgi:hypothetical protein